MKILYSILFWSLTGVVAVLAQDDPWSYIVLADWHGAEHYSVIKEDSVIENDKTYTNPLAIFKHIKDTYGGDLIILPGDIQTGHWDKDSYRKKLFQYNPDLPESMTTNEIISLAADNCYRRTKKLFKDSGFDTTLLAIGDHEIGTAWWCYYG